MIVLALLAGWIATQLTCAVVLVYSAYRRPRG